MSLSWKILLALAVVLPLGGFVVGSLVGVADDDPLPRQPIVLRDSDDGSDRPAPSRAPDGGDGRGDVGEDERADDPDDHVVSPRPYDGGDDGVPGGAGGSGDDDRDDEGDEEDDDRDDDGDDREDGDDD